MPAILPVRTYWKNIGGFPLVRHLVVVNHQRSPDTIPIPPHVRTCEKNIGGFTGARNPVKHAK